MKFLIDMTPLAVTHLRVIGHDAVHAHEIALARASAIQLLDAARLEERVIVTADLDYPRLLALHRPAVLAPGGRLVCAPGTPVTGSREPQGLT